MQGEKTAAAANSGTQDLSLTRENLGMRQDQTRKAASGRPEYEKDGIQKDDVKRWIPRVRREKPLMTR